MANTVQCDIVSAQENIFSGKVEMLTATASNGELGVMAGHAPCSPGLRQGR